MRRRSLSLSILCLAALPGAPGSVRAETVPCDPAGPTPATEWLARARHAVGMAGTAGVLRAPISDVYQFNYQSDRPYPPFAIQVSESLSFLDPATGVEWLGQPGAPSRGLLVTERAAHAVRDSATVPAPEQFATVHPARWLNPWALLADWSATPEVRVKGRCRYRDYRRIVLARTGPAGEERLFLHEGTGFPIRAERSEPHYLFGQVEAAYLYLTWFDPLLPWTAVRTIDGQPEIERSYAGRGRVVPRDSAPGLAAPDGPDMRAVTATFLTPTPPDTSRAGPRTLLLRNVGYTEAITLVGDTVFVLDATQAESRARADSQWIGRVFPGRHPIVVIVTDLAWPHIAGVRFWVAAGATIVSHRANRAFLERVVTRRWTLEPDALERRRERARFRFRAVDDSATFGGGGLRALAIDGVGSEGSLMVYLPGERFLWAGDYLQRADRPTLYTGEVRAALDRHGLRPERVAAQHLPLTEWRRIAALTER